MNERIKELAEQAGYDITPFYTGEDNYQTPHYKDEKLEKFAELIVRECAELMYGRDENGNCKDGDVIKKHFGVKE